jgi:hypothetical protein
MGSRSQVVLSCQTLIQEVLALLRHVDRLRDLREQFATCYYLLSQVEVLVINFVAPRRSSVKHLNNGTAKRPDITLTA